MERRGTLEQPGREFSFSNYEAKFHMIPLSTKVSRSLRERGLFGTGMWAAWRLVANSCNAVAAPAVALRILNSHIIDPVYRMTVLRKMSLGLKMYYNSRRIQMGTSYKSHLAMALKLLEIPPDAPGAVVECGCWKGGSTANLSLVCRIVGRKLKVYDSFEGLPEGVPGDREAKHYKKGDYAGTLDEVKDNVSRYGAIKCCEFIKGWHEDTLPSLNSPVLLSFIDVDLEASLDTCVRYIWPNLVDNGYMFIDEFVLLDYCALFYSEKFWRDNFDRVPPGLIGAGVGLALGEYYIGPWAERNFHPSQNTTAAAYTRKDMTGYWAFYPRPTG
jgi:O-methyltransferase